MKQWDAIYKREGRRFISPLGYLPELLKLLKKRNVTKVLDLGRGSGAYISHLAKDGFEVYGIDVSQQAIEIAEKRFKEDKLEGNLTVGSIYKRLPYEDDFFDAVISFRTIHHARIRYIRKAIKEIERILKPHGLVFMTIRKRIPARRMTKHKMLDSRTYVPEEGDEKGIVHHLFNKRLLRKEFRNFRIHQLRIDHGKQQWERYYCLIGELKDPRRKRTHFRL